MAHGQPADANNRAIDSRAVRANDRLQHFWRNSCQVGIKVHHRSANVAHHDRDGRGIASLADNIWPKSSYVRACPCESRDFAHRFGGDTEMLASSKMPCFISTGAPYRRPISVAKSSPETAISSPPGVPRLRRQLPLGIAFTAQRSKQDQLGQLACG